MMLWPHSGGAARVENLAERAALAESPWAYCGHQHRGTSSCAAPTVSLQTQSVSGLSVSINGVAAWGSGCTGTAIQWSWGDGSTGAQWFPASHTYSSSGTYSVTATAQQSDGQTASASASVTVYPSTFGQQPLLEDWPVLLTVRGADTPYRHLERAAPE